jgi:hypothetical protein
MKPEGLFDTKIRPPPAGTKLVLNTRFSQCLVLDQFSGSEIISFSHTLARESGPPKGEATYEAPNIPT